MAHNAENMFSQLLRFMLCTILLITSFPFIGLAAIFSLFTDLPHLKIELGNDNAIESVYFNVKNTEKKEDEDTDEDEEEEVKDEDSGYDGEKEDNESETDIESDEEENPELYSLTEKFMRFFFEFKIINATASETTINKIIREYLDDHEGTVGKTVNWDEDLWKLLDLDDNEEEYTLDDIYEKLKEKKLMIPIKKIELCSTPVCNTPIRCPDAPRRIRGRVGSLGDDSPMTPSKLDMAQLANLMNDKLTLDTGIVLSNITPIPCESFEQEDGAQTPSECPPSS
jgi:hypothetical protein